jgi:hypothetical protein
VKDGNGDLLAHSRLLNRWKHHFSELLNVYSVSDVRQRDVHAAQPLIHGPSLEVVIATVKLKRCKLPSSDQIPVELIRAVGEVVVFVFEEGRSV